jgi:hypothetical protein
MKRKRYMHEYYLKNRIIILKKTKLYHNKHKKSRDLYLKNYRKLHKIKSHNYSKIWRYTIKGIYSHLKDKAKRRNILFDLIFDSFFSWYKKQKKICIYCKRSEKQAIKDRNGNYKRLTIDRKDNNKGYTLDNLGLCCYKCNAVKGADLTFKEMSIIGKYLKKIFKNRN